MSDKDSRSISLAWSKTSFNDCTTSAGFNPSTHHFWLTYKDATAPDEDTPTDGTLLVELPGTQSGYTHTKLRANKTYGYAVYACIDADANECDDWCTVADTEVEDNTLTAAPETEQWRVTGIVDDTDLHRIVADGGDGPNTPAAIRMIAGDDADKVAVYYRDDDGFHVVENSCTAAPDEDWNDNAVDCNWGTSVQVLEPTDGGLYDFIADPSVLQIDDGASGVAVRVTFVVTDSLGSPSVWYLYTIDSDDDEGEDFLTECDENTSPCTTTGCDEGEDEATHYCDFGDNSTLTQILDAADSGNDFQKLGWHGRSGWDYILDAQADDDYSHLFSAHETSSCTADTQADINLIDYDWSADSYTLLLATSPCADDVIESRHDPSITPYPNGVYKVYVKNGTDSFDLSYTDDFATFEDTSQISFVYDDSPTDTEFPEQCVEDVSTVIFKEGSTIEEVMFFTVDDGATGCDFEDGEGGILAAVLEN